jgi:hypothetical protein
VLQFNFYCTHQIPKLTMQSKTLFSKWTQIASLLLIGGALAWALKLGVIISTNGRIIDTGAAALLMKIGLVMLVFGSTGIGSRLSADRKLWLRTIAIIVSPVVVFGLFLLFARLLGPLFKYSSLWYAQQEAPIALAVVFYMTIGYFLYKSYKPVLQ